MTSENEDLRPDDPATPEGPGKADPTEQGAGESPEPAAERDRLRDQLLRTAADFDNFRKRAKRDVQDAERRGREDTVREMLTIIDNLERAVDAASGASDASAVADGVRMVLRQFEDVAARLGVERIPAVGERFDPTLHEAVQQEPTDAHPPGMILHEVVPGYRMGDRLVRAAMVVVARPKPAPAAQEEGGQDG